MGLAMVPMCWPLRRLLGRGAAFAAAVLFAFGPSYLYFSRFAREDIYVAAITLALLVVDLALPGQAAQVPPGADRRAAGAVVRDQGDDVHHGLRDGLVLPRRARDPAAGAAQVWGPVRRRRAGRAGAGSLAAFAGHVHDPLHDLPDAPGRALGRHLHRPGVLARPARRRAAAASPRSSTASCW